MELALVELQVQLLLQLRLQHVRFVTEDPWPKCEVCPKKYITDEHLQTVKHLRNFAAAELGRVSSAEPSAPPEPLAAGAVARRWNRRRSSSAEIHHV